MNIVKRDFSRANYSNPFVDRVLSYFLDKVSDKIRFKGTMFEWSIRRFTTTDEDVTGKFLCVHYVLLNNANYFKRTLRVDMSIKLNSN